MHTQLPGYRRERLEPKNLALFIVIAFGWSWAWWFLFIFDVLKMPTGVGTPEMDLGTAGPILLLVALTPYGPTLGAFLITAITEGRQGVRALWKRFWNRKLTLKWLAISLLLFPFLRLVTNLVGRLAGTDIPLLAHPSEPWIATVAFIASLINGGLSEEFGWRGYALPRLQARWNALTSSLILGVIEGLWHAPLLLMPGQRHENSVLELVFWMTLTIILRTWIFNNTDGSVLAAVLAHAMGNTASDIVYCCASLSHLYVVYTVAVVLVVLLFGPKSLRRESAGGDDADRRRRVRANQWLTLGLLGLILTGCTAPAGDFVGVNQHDPAHLDEIDRIVAEFRPNYAYINIALIRDGEIVLTKTCGSDRLERTDVYVYASVSKPVTAMILVQLLEQGQIGSINDPIATYDIRHQDAQPAPYADTPITFEHLLTHQSGVPHQSAIWGIGGNLNMDFCPGTDVQYSTKGYGILGDAMEEITGQSYERLVLQYIGEPVGASSFQARHRFVAPGGLVYSTIYDMARFAASVMDESSVTDDVLQNLIAQRYAEDNCGMICLGWYCSDLGTSDLTLYHAGSNGRPRAYLRINPLQGLGVAITGLNRSRDGAHDLEELSIQLIEALGQG